MAEALPGLEGWQATQALIAMLENALLPPAPPEDRFYAWQPLEMIDFLRGMKLAQEARPPSRFLDVGSGIGSKLALASALGWDAHGLERHEPYARVSGQLFGDLPVVMGDAFEFDGYAEFDLVYCYRVCVDPGEQHVLNERIASMLAPGALFFSAGGPWPEWLTHVGGQVWEA